jgi:protocatechuate 3,4-dioxygenase beta subunit
MEADCSVWETDGDGFYDVQYVEGAGPDCRGRLYTREDGTYDFVAIKPVSYPISNDGPVGALLRALGRHWMRPAHMHFMIYHPEFNKLVTALYTRDDKYVTSDTGIPKPLIALTLVFGVKSSLMVDYKWTEDVELAKKYKIPNPEKGFWLLDYDFKLMPRTPPKVLKVKDD